MRVPVVNRTRQPLPRLPFARVAREILGERYELSLAFVGARAARTLNARYRGKDYPANVLAFPLSPHSGEIIIQLGPRASAHPPLFLFIHACLHLKGLRHGSTMERTEQELYIKYSDTKHRHRH